MGDLFVWLDLHFDVFLAVAVLVLIWWLLPILAAWQYAIMRRLRRGITKA